MGRVKRYLFVSPRQQANMQEAPYSARKAEELRKSRIMAVDTAIRSNSSKFFDKNREEFNTDSAFIFPFAVMAFLVLVMIVFSQMGKNKSSRDEQMKALEEKYGKTNPYVEPSANAAGAIPSQTLPTSRSEDVRS